MSFPVNARVTSAMLSPCLASSPSTSIGRLIAAKFDARDETELIAADFTA